MRRFLVCLVGMSALFVGIAPAVATTVDANWWSNQTSSAGVLDPPGPLGPERVRLAEGHNTGFIEGTVALPSNGRWQIDTSIFTDSNFDIPSEYVKQWNCAAVPQYAAELHLRL